MIIILVACLQARLKPDLFFSAMQEVPVKEGGDHVATI